eukprot:1065204_1
MSDVESLLNQLWTIQESDRKKGTKLLSTILDNLSNTLSESTKYGNLNCAKISGRLSRCKPAFVLLLRAGFKQSNDGKRLIWTYDEDAIESLYHVYNALQTTTVQKMQLLSIFFNSFVNVQKLVVCAKTGNA